MINSKDLLDELAYYAGCSYISDLPRPEHTKDLLSALDMIDETRYSLEDWNEVVQYITREEKSFGSVKEAKDFLHKVL